MVNSNAPAMMIAKSKYSKHFKSVINTLHIGSTQ